MNIERFIELLKKSMDNDETLNDLQARVQMEETIPLPKAESVDFGKN